MRIAMMSDTPHHTAKYISSQKKEYSEIHNQVINLGKLLVKELALEPGVDTLSRWMVHYISELMVSIENTSGSEKQELEKNCFDTILKLWDHRSSYSGGKRPFENYEPIFRALNSLDPDNNYPHYRMINELQQTKEEDTNNNESGVQEWINIALNIESTAKIFVQYALEQATSHATDQKTKEWLTNAMNIGHYDDVSIILKYVSADDDTTDQQERENEEHKNRLKERVKKLDTFVEFSSLVREALSNELSSIS